MKIICYSFFNVIARGEGGEGRMSQIINYSSKKPLKRCHFQSFVLRQWADESISNFKTAQFCGFVSSNCILTFLVDAARSFFLITYVFFNTMPNCVQLPTKRAKDMELRCAALHSCRAGG